MTELHIERKERSVWPWVLGILLLLALLLWFLFGRGDGAADTAGIAAADSTVAVATTPAAATGDEALPPAVGELVRFAATRPDAGVTQAHDYTADGLRRLADALGAVAQGVTVSGVDVEERLGAIRAQADAMQRDPTSTQHALQTREAFLLASGLMRQLQEARFAGLANEVGEVNDAASAVQPDRPLLDQTAEVQRFFDRAANAVREMARAG